MKIVFLAALVALTVGSTIPDNFDARTAWPQCSFFILNQEQCGSCWDFCSMESFADRLCIDGEVKSGTIITPEPILDCSKQGCDGGFPSTAWNWVIDNGNTDCTNQCFGGCSPYDSGDGSSPACHEGTCDSGSTWTNEYHAGSFESLSGLFNHDLGLYQTELMTYGSVQACFTVYENFYTFFSLKPKGIYTAASGQNLGGHCVKMLGWGTEDGQDYWLFANSWDTTWADGGYFKMARGNNLCGIEGQVSEGFTAAQTARLGKPKGVHPNVRLVEKKVGGWTKQENPSDNLHVEAAVLGLNLVSRQRSREFTLHSILAAETQVVAGLNFKITAQTNEGEVIAMRLYRDLNFNHHLVEHDLVF